jgi:hypothetical protein
MSSMPRALQAENAKQRRRDLGLPEGATEEECDAMDRELHPPPEPEVEVDKFAVPGLKAPVRPGEGAAAMPAHPAPVCAWSPLWMAAGGRRD